MLTACRRQMAVAAFAWALGATGGAVLAKDAAEDPALIEAAKKEGEVVWYTGLVLNQASRPLAEAFEKKYPGIKVALSYNGGETLLKLMAEARSGQRIADVQDGSGQTVAAMVAANLVEPYRPPAAAHFPEKLKSKDGYWTAITLFYASPAINTQLVGPADAPKTYADLLDPKWRGKMAWSTDLNSAGANGIICNILLTMGEEAGMAYLKKLAQQNVASVAANQRVVLDQVIAGQYPLSLGAYRHHVAISQGKGAKVEAIIVGRAIEHMGTISLIKGARHPNAAKLLMNYILSKEGQTVLRESNYVPADPGISAKTATVKPLEGKFEVTTYSPDNSEEQLDRCLRIYEEMFK